MKIAAIVQIEDDMSIYIVRMPYHDDDEEIFNLLDRKMKRYVNADALVVDFYRNVRYATITMPDVLKLNLQRSEQIVDIVCRVLKLNYDQVISRSRERKYTDARAIICHHIHARCNLTLTMIGECVGNRNHATVINAMRNYDAYTDTDPTFQEKANAVNEAINRHPNLSHYVDK